MKFYDVTSKQWAQAFRLSADLEKLANESKINVTLECLGFSLMCGLLLFFVFLGMVL